MPDELLQILYDDGPCLIVNKPAGLLTQAPRGIDSMELRVKQFYRQREGKPRGANIYLGLAHRIDRPVSGALVFARHVRAARKLCSQFADRTVSKVYWAVVEGQVQPEEGTSRPKPKLSMPTTRKVSCPYFTTESSGKTMK